MKVQVRLSVLLLIVVVVGVVFGTYLWSVRGKYHSETNELKTALYKANKESKNYEMMVNGLTEYVSETELMVLTKDKEIFNLKEEGERLRKLNIKHVNTIGRLEIRIAFLVDSIPPSDTIIIKEEVDGSYIKLPLAYTFKDYYADMNTLVGMDGLATMNFKLSNIDINIVLGERGGFFKRNENVSVVTTNCKYVEFEVSNFAIITNAKPPLVFFGAGALAALSGIILLNLLIH